MFHFSISDGIGGKTLLTYTKNYGSISNSVPFTPGKKQFYGCQEIYYRISDKNLIVKAAIGIVIGQLSSVTGFMFGIEWSFPTRGSDEYDTR